ncbi:peptidoglycan DD-metalloendopeptidase family protein [Derxia lacustris]|uniref:peptidoglycan DD-metalloendopeptidase family protein n=1 Tax=Derxia lacustris TaxID=764842 RepID=UPI000A172093|nr:peptidoglycan DD-metalloendopeptidase family protein [Derxia lacustris]
MPKSLLSLPPKSRLRLSFTALLLGLLAACSSPQRQAPIVDRSSASASAGAAATASSGSAPIVSAGGAAGYTGAPRSYVVRKGDTLYKIAVEHGKDYRDIAALNQLESPDRIIVGQTLRIDPAEGASPAAGVPAVATPVVIGAPLENRPLGDAAKPATRPPADAAPAKPADTAKPPEAAKPAPATDAPKPAASDDGPITWAWPTGGRVIEGFDEARNKGLDLGGAIGDPVLAASDGKVVYAGNGLRGYGQLLIVKHNDNYLSAYAHNSKLIAQYGDSVKRGQKIAELGNSDSDRPKLHFEIRRQGKPVDPTRFLPAR